MGGSDSGFHVSSLRLDRSDVLFELALEPRVIAQLINAELLIDFHQLKASQIWAS